MKKGVGSESGSIGQRYGSGNLDPDPDQDQMSRIPNTRKQYAGSMGHAGSECCKRRKASALDPNSDANVAQNNENYILSSN